ncbi:response regulator transcription factor [uncultured Draconibacterium sp.]|uniref:response regulator n=1 Tax=uncultured Draconibacterium sp. TaxID=1573823 RepID=UPI0025FC35B5|nr:response regulator transcription factor [uncultured Draconibacterium sp.]
MNTPIAIIDDNNFLIKSVKDKLSFLTDISIVFTANDGQQCLEKLNLNARVKLILMDIEMPRLNGIEATAQIKQKYPQIKIIMLTVFDDDENIFKAIQSGADGYLLKETSSPELYNAILQTLEGGAAMTPSIALKTLNLLRSPLPIANNEVEDSVKLTGREVEVLEQLAVGLPYKSIAENLIISPSTVRRHIENIYKKLQVHSKVEAIELAKRKRII